MDNTQPLLNNVELNNVTSYGSTTDTISKDKTQEVALQVLGEQPATSAQPAPSSMCATVLRENKKEVAALAMFVMMYFMLLVGQRMIGGTGKL